MRIEHFMVALVFLGAASAIAPAFANENDRIIPLGEPLPAGTMTIDQLPRITDADDVTQRLAAPLTPVSANAVVALDEAAPAMVEASAMMEVPAMVEAPAMVEMTTMAEAPAMIMEETTEPQPRFIAHNSGSFTFDLD